MGYAPRVIVWTGTTSVSSVRSTSTSAAFLKGASDGLAAIERRDYGALTNAVRAEASAIAGHSAALKQLNDTIKSRGK